MFSPILLAAHNPGPMTGQGNNTYLIVAPTGAAALIDAGVGDARHLADLDRELNVHGAHLTHVLVTHGHGDHASGATAIAAAHSSAKFLKLPWPGQDDRYGVDWQPIEEGDRIDLGGETLTVMHSPGHSPDHVTFWHESSRTAFTGDLVVAGSSVMIHWSRGGDLSAYLASIQRLLDMSPQTLFPGHGPKVEDPAVLLTAYLEHRRMRERQVIESLTAGRETVEAIAQSIYDGLEPALMPAARENVRAHLEKLKAEHLIADESGKWRIRG
jgi:glyoxylase-like metal-dependent hydrolase (beta-lactamase superfamily II)